MTVALRSGLTPLVLLLLAFYAMVVSSAFDLDRGLARLLVAISTPAVIAGVLIWQFAAH